MTETEFLDATAVFRSSPVSSGGMFDEQSSRRPTIVSGWDESSLELGAESSHFGFVHCGRTMLSCGSGSFELSSGMYFSVPGAATVKGSGVGFAVSCSGLRGLFQMGGPIEEKGRLQYIDGCSDTLLIAPATLGDPCLNLLHIPPHTNQTSHTHPSLRVGMVVDGQGVCRTPEGDVALTPGLVFVIRTGGLHSFHTRDRSLRIVAWHPDSDFGPTHDNHPMVNRTLVDGQPVNTKKDSQ